MLKNLHPVQNQNQSKDLVQVLERLQAVFLGQAVLQVPEVREVCLPDREVVDPVQVVEFLRVPEVVALVQVAPEAAAHAVPEADHEAGDKNKR